jgi:hypothetical protein
MSDVHTQNVLHINVSMMYAHSHHRHLLAMYFIHILRSTTSCNGGVHWHSKALTTQQLISALKASPSRNNCNPYHHPTLLDGSMLPLHASD